MTSEWKEKDEQIAKELWDKTCQLLYLEPDENFAVFLKTISRQIE